MTTDNLAVAYRGREVLAGVDLEVGPGITAVVGGNGAGKSSLLRVLATVTRPASGRLLIGGSPATSGAELQAARRHLGYLPQEWDLPAGTRVIDALHFAAWTQRLPAGSPAVEEAIDAFGLEEIVGTRLSQLSTGTRRRVAIAQATVHRPTVLLLDEPTAGLDAAHRLELWAVLLGLEAGATVLVATHDLVEVEQYGEGVLVVGNGAVRQQGPSTAAALLHQIART